MRRKKTRTSPEERARWGENQQRLLEAIQRHDQRLENGRAEREGRPPRVVPLRAPTSDEARDALERAIARIEASSSTERAR